MMKFIKNNWLGLIGLMFLIVGAGLLVRAYMINLDVAQKTEEAKQTYSQQIEKQQTEEVLTVEEQENEHVFENIELSENQQENTNSWLEDFDTRGLIVGKVAVSNTYVSVPIYKGVYRADGTDNMLYGGATNKQNQAMGSGNYVISSHIVQDKTKLFSDLARSNTGDYIYLADSENLYTYEINKAFQVLPTDTWIMNETIEPTVTLYTCIYVGGFLPTGEQKTERTVRQGVLVDKRPLQEADKDLFGF